MKEDDSSTASLQSRFRELFGDTEDVRVAIGPGRVNLIGEHTDYNDGWVLPMAIDRHVEIAFSPRNDLKIRAHSLVFDQSREIPLDDLESCGGTGWSSYVAGTAWAMVQSGLAPIGVDLLIDGDVPLGSGLSSSAALEMATARALCEASEIPWRPKEMALLGRKAENDFVGVSCGAMDQLASACAEPGCALLLDCRTLDMEAVLLPSDVLVVVMDTGIRRTLAGSEYNDRRSSCEKAVHALRELDPAISALRDADLEVLEAARSRMQDLTYRRARHVIEENQRPRVMATALQSGRLDEAGFLMNDSHASLRDLYEVSSPELDHMTELARRHPACFGARLTGAGFGGCAVALVAVEGVEEFSREVDRAYRADFDIESEIFVCRPGGGASLAPGAGPREMLRLATAGE